MKHAKYGNTKMAIDGITFDSKAEASRYAELKILERAGQITGLELQPKFTVLDKYTIGGRKERAVIYIPDFKYTDTKTGVEVVEDVKGFETKDFKIKRKLFESRYGIELRLVK